MLIASVILYLLLSVVFCRAFFGKFSLANYLITFFITTYATNILICETLSLLGILNNLYFYFGLQTLFTALFTFLVMKNWSLTWQDLLPQKMEKIDFLSALLSLFIAIPLLVLLLVGLHTAPNNLDSLHTHLPRIYYWLQHGSLANWASSNLWQAIYPINANLQGLWIFLFGHDEHLFFLVSWFALLITCVSVYQIARVFHFTRHQALVSALVVLTIPAAVLQTYSFQNDLSVTAMVIVAIYLFVLYFQSKQISQLALALLSLAIATGIKQTGFMVLPAITLWVLYKIFKRQFEKKHLIYLLLFPAFFLLFSSYQYIQNKIDFGSFFGINVLNGQTETANSVLNKFEYNIPRYAYNTLSVDGLNRPLAESLTVIKASVFKAISSFMHINLESTDYLTPGFDPSERFSYSTIPDLTEDTSWLGPLSVLLAILALIVIVFKKDKERKEYLLFCLVLFFSYSLAILIQRPGWDPYQGRYFILALIPIIPLVGICIPDKGFFKFFTLFLVTISFAILSFNICCFNESKPILTAQTMTTWQNSFFLQLPKNNKIEKQFRSVSILISNKLVKTLPQRSSILEIPYYNQLFYSNHSSLDDFNMITSHLTSTQPLWLDISQSILEYPLFGINHARDLYPISNPDQTSLNGYLLIQNDRTADMQNFLLVDSNNTYSLYQRVK